MSEKTLKEHVTEIARLRWSLATEEQRKQHARMMNAHRWPEGAKSKKTQGARRDLSDTGSTGEKENPTPEG